MRAHLEIDSDLIGAAMKLTGLNSEQAAIEKALSEFIEVRQAQLEMLAFEGKVGWEGDLDAMRRNR